MEPKAPKFELEYVIGLAVIALAGLGLCLAFADANRSSERIHERKLARIRALEAGVHPLALPVEAGEE
jgi:hypothetical protein